ncbi:UNVERIFIED_CONTAM: hypothetical protein RMT77_001645 [Armadillidium vulgare]
MGHYCKLPKGLKLPSDVEDLKEILLNVEPRLQPIPLIRRHVSRFVDGADMDEVYPKLWLGDCDAATNVAYLQRHGITHVLNAADNKTGPAPVKTGPDFYKGAKIKYLGLDLIDLPFANVARHFVATAEFLEDALSTGGTVLVHCRQGRSRSASIVIGFLMIKKNFTAGEALKRLREYREVRPNNSFLQQIADYDLQLFRERLAYYRSLPSSSSSSSSESDSESICEEVEKESLDSDSFKTVFSEPILTDTADSREQSILDDSDEYESCHERKIREKTLSESETIYIPKRPSTNDNYEFASCKELSAEFSINLVIDYDYDSDDESSDSNDF